MGSNLQWVFELSDKMSGPAKKIASNLRTTQRVIDAMNRTPLHLTEAANKRSLSSRAFSGIVNTAGSLFGAKGAQAVLGTANALVKADSALGMVGTSLGAVVGGGALAATAALAAVGGMAVYAGMKLSSMAIDYGMAGAQFVIQSASFREDSLLGLQAMLKSKEAAATIYKKAVKLASVTPFNTKEVIGMTQSLIGGGFKPEELTRVMTAVGDMAAARGMNKELIGRLNLAMSQIRAKGKLQGNEVMQLMEAGLNKGVLNQKIGAMMGGKTSAQIEKLQEAGKISSQVAIEAILQTIEEGYGGTMDLQSGGMTGLLSTLGSRPFEFVDKAMSGSGGLDSFMRSVKFITKTLTDIFDPETIRGGRIVRILDTIGWAFADIFPSGNKVVGVLDKIIDAVEKLMPDVKSLARELGDGLNKLFPEDSSGIETFGRAIITTLRMVTAVADGFATGMMATLGAAFAPLDGDPQANIEKMRAGFEKIGKTLGEMVGHITSFITGVADAAAKVAAFMDKFKLNDTEEAKYQEGDIGAKIADWMTKKDEKTGQTGMGDWWDAVSRWNAGAEANPGAEQGKAVADGYVQAIVNAAPVAYAAGATLASSTAQGLADRNQSQSPSRVFAQQGMWATEGYLEGMATPDLDGAIRNTFAMPSGGFGGGSFGGSPVTIGSISVSAPLSLSGADTETAGAAQDAVARLLPTALADALEQVAAEWGLA